MIDVLAIRCYQSGTNKLGPIYGLSRTVWLYANMDMEMNVYFIFSKVGALPSYGLMSYPGQWGGGLPLRRDAVGISYSPSQLKL